MVYRETSFVKYVLCVVIVLANIALTLYSLGEVLPIDLTTYGYMAHEMLGGAELYTNLWDHKPPGVFLAFMGAELLWGYSPSGVVFLGLVFSLISLVFLFFFVRKLAGLNAAIISAALWTLAQNSVYLEANLPNVEVFLNAFTLVALWAFARFYDDEGRLWPLFISGGAMAVASLFKMVAVFPLIALCVYSILVIREAGFRSRRGEAIKRLLALLVPGAVLWSAVFGYFLAVGRFGAFWETVFVYNSRYSGGLIANITKPFLLPNLFFHPSLKEVWVLALFSFAWLVFSRKVYGPVRRSLLVLFFFGVLVEILSPGKYYFHYYQLLLPVLAILPALFFTDLVSRSEMPSPLRRNLRSAFLLVTFVVLGWYQWGYISRGPEGNSVKKYGREYIEVRDAALFVKNITAPCETIYSWGEETGFYYYSQRQAASGIFFIYALFFESEVDKVMKLDRLYGDLTALPPAVFIVEDRWAGRLDFRFKTFLAQSYQMPKKVNAYSIYELKGRVRPGC